VLEKSLERCGPPRSDRCHGGGKDYRAAPIEYLVDYKPRGGLLLSMEEFERRFHWIELELASADNFTRVNLEFTIEGIEVLQGE
jgi:hypothetical protein